MILRTIAATVLVAGLLAVCPYATFGQSTLGAVRGSVRDAQHQPVPGAAVVATDQATDISRTIESSRSGDYELANLRAGRYAIQVRASGFKVFERRDVTIGAGDTVRVDIALEIGPATETVFVVANRTVDIERPAIEIALGADQLRTLPRNARDIQSFLTLTPNVVGDADNRFQFLGGRTYGASYVQDGQPSTGAIFGNVGDAAPGLEAVSEFKVLSNAFGAEFGGLAAVVVTTARGGNTYSGSAFYDTNSDELNALTYAQKDAGLTRGFPGSNTHDHQFGIALGGPVRKNKTFFFANYEGARRTSVGGGQIVNVPTDRMRAGDFSANSFVVRDPLTGTPFPGNVIPFDRIDPSARSVLDLFYPHATLAPIANGLGRAQQFVNLSTRSDRADVRGDHEITPRDSLFLRVSWQRTDPGTSFEDARFPNLGVQDRRLSSRTAAAGWTHARSATFLNELRGGYSSDRSNRHSRFVASDVTSMLGLDLPATGTGRRGYPAFVFQGSDAIRGIADNSQNADRDTRSSAISVSDTLTWLRGTHSIKTGGGFIHHAVLDGFSLGVPGAVGSYVFSGAQTGNSFSDFLLGLPSRTDVGVNMRGVLPLDAHAGDVALFVQDDWKVSNRLTIFGGLRYEVTGPFVERNDLLVNFNPATGALVLPSAEIGALLPQDARRLPVQLAHDLGVSRALVRTDTNNVGPRAGFAYRVGEDGRTVVRSGVGKYFPLSAAQGIRDALSRSPFRYATSRTAAVFSHGFTTGIPSDRSLFGVNAVDLGLQSPEAWQYNVTVERELTARTALRVSLLGSRFSRLLVNRDINTVSPSTIPFDLDNPADRERLPYPTLDPFLNVVENAGRGYYRALQVETRSRFAAGASIGATYTLSGSESTAPDLGNSSLGVVQYAPYDLELDRGPDPNVVTHRFLLDATWSVRGWTVAAVFQARSGQHLTPFFTYGTGPVFPANTGKAYDTNSSFDEAWRPDVIGDPRGAGDRDDFFNLDAFRLPAPGTVGNARKGLLEGPGAWVTNLGVYRAMKTVGRVRTELRVTVDNLFNTPQFLVTSTSGFLDLTDFLINGVRDNGVTNVLNETGSLEGFASARVVRIGIRMTF